jgi:hypothetical protein
MKRLLPLLALTLAACSSLSFSGASAPTDYTVRLTPADLAFVNTHACEQTWVTGNAEADLRAGAAILADHNVTLAVGNPVATATALARKLVVTRDYAAFPDAQKVHVLSHELVHYCHRDLLGNAQFDADYLNSPGRWRTETPAHLQSFRTMRIQCATIQEVESAIEDRLVSMRDQYLLWDLDPEQYMAETRRIWRTALDTPGC